MRSVRRSVWVLAGLSTALPAAFLGVVFLPFLIPGTTFSSGVGKTLLAGWLATTVARGLTARHLNSVEQIVDRFWGFTPLLTMTMAAVLGVLPLFIKRPCLLPGLVACFRPGRCA